MGLPDCGAGWARRGSETATGNGRAKRAKELGARESYAIDSSTAFTRGGGGSICSGGGSGNWDPGLRSGGPDSSNPSRQIPPFLRLCKESVTTPTYRGRMDILMLSDVYFPRVNGVSTSIRTF